MKLAGVSSTDFNNIELCSGDNWCKAAQLQAAEASIKKIVNAEMKIQVDYIERYDAEGFMNNMGDALTNCLSDVLNAMVANWAQMQMCNTMAQFCGGQSNGLPLQDYTVQQGESMGFGNALNPSSLLSNFNSVLSNVFCHETQLGANIQYLAGMTQSPQGRAYLTQMLMNHLESNSQPVKTVLSPVTPEPSPMFNFVLKGAADNATSLTHPGFNIYSLTYNPQTALQNNNYEATFISFGSNGWVLPSIEKGINNVAGLPTATLTYLFYTIPTAVYTAATAKSSVYPNASLTSGAMPYLSCSSTPPINCFVSYTKDDTDVNLYTVNKYQLSPISIKSSFSNTVLANYSLWAANPPTPAATTTQPSVQSSQSQLPVTVQGLSSASPTVKQPPIITIQSPTLVNNLTLTNNNQLQITQTTGSTASCINNLIDFIFDSTTPQSSTAGTLVQTTTSLSCTPPKVR